MLIVFHTQYKENYGNAEKPHWKFKGGSEFILDYPKSKFTPEEVEADVNKVSTALEHKSDHQEVHVIGISYPENGYESEFVKSQKEYGDYPVYLDPLVDVEGNVTNRHLHKDGNIQTFKAKSND